MQIIRGSHTWAATTDHYKSAVVAVGNFDGVHLGHQALLGQAQAAARLKPWGVLTFDPHPARFFAPALAPPMIMPLQQRLDIIGGLGAHFALVETFDAALASLTPREFVHEYLHRKLQVSRVVVGYDFAFGKGRKGSTQDLNALAAEVGIGVDVMGAVGVKGLVCSSTKIREFVLEGRVEGAALLLGRPFTLEGMVVKGAQRGRHLGYPTANIAAQTELLPRAGVYAAWAIVPDGAGERSVMAAVSVGTNPTFTQSGTLSIEAHLVNFSADLYGQRLRVEFVARLRDERSFGSLENLVAAIGTDVEQTRQLLSKPPANG
jgi:riboflavin kinase/FMN adenylyltransferase